VVWEGCSRDHRLPPIPIGGVALAQCPEPNVPPPARAVVVSVGESEVRCPEPKVPGPFAESVGVGVVDARRADAGAVSALVGVLVHAVLARVTITAAIARRLNLRMDSSVTG